MKYNLTQYVQTTSTGTLVLTTDEIIEITSSTAANVAIPPSGVYEGDLILESDLGARVHIDEVRYYFDSPNPKSTVASGIKFYYKNESFEIYVSLSTYYNNDYYYTIVSGTSAPRYIKVEHTVASGISGQLNNFYVMNDDDYVDFGSDSTQEETNFILSIENELVEINELKVFNDGPTIANARLILEPQNTVADSVLSISDSADGPWYGIYDENDLIVGSNTWQTGAMVNVVYEEGVLKLDGINTVGTYTTKIIGIDEFQKTNFCIIDYEYPTTASGKSIIATDDVDTYENIEIKSSNSRPLDRLTYIETIYEPGINKHVQHRWAEDGTIESTSSSFQTFTPLFSGGYFEYYCNSRNENLFLVDKNYSPSGNTFIYFRLFDKDYNQNSITIASADYNSDRYYSTYKVVHDTTGGLWIYYYIANTTSDNGSFYLKYYDNTLTEIYSRSATAAQGTFLFDMDVVYNSLGHLWYTDSDLSTVFKIDKDGTILTSYLATNLLRGIAALDDGGCWFIQDQGLIRLDSAGNQIDSIELGYDTVSYVHLDKEDGFWLHDGINIRYLDSSGTEVFSITRPNLYWFDVVDSGVITKEHDGTTTSLPQATYISKEYQDVVRTWDYPRTEGAQKGSFDYNRYGFRSQTFDDLTEDHSSNFPIAIDDAWVKNNTWKKVSLRDYNFTNEQYHQIRLTLRATYSNNSPEVDSIYAQRAIDIPGIYPGNRGTFYLKSDVSNLDPEDVGNYTSNVRAYWFIDTE